MLKKGFFSRIFRISSAAFLLSAIAFTSCSPAVNVQQKPNGDILVSFRTGFSQIAAKTLRSISGVADSDPIFYTEDIETALKSFKIRDARATIPSPTEIAAEGNISSISENELSKSGILKSSKNSLSLSLGPDQFRALYDILDETSQAYFDMLMIPSLIGETMSLEDYKKLVASLYGATFANELLNGTLSIKLSSPLAKSKISETVSVGEILTLSETKTWSISW